MPARRLLHRPRARRGRSRRRHARPFRSRPRRPRRRARHARNDRGDGHPLWRRNSRKPASPPAMARPRASAMSMCRLHPRRPRHRLGPGRGEVEGPHHGLHRRLQAPRRSHLRAVRSRRPATSSSRRRPSRSPSSAIRTAPAKSRKLLASIRAFPDRAHLVGAYAFGKAQRVIRELRDAGYNETDLHPRRHEGAVRHVRAPRRRSRPARTRHAREEAARAKAQKFAGKIIICPPSATGTPWAERFPDPVIAFASGWMNIRQRAKAGGIELPLDPLRPRRLGRTHRKPSAT